MANLLLANIVDILETLSKALECPVCLDTFKSPIVSCSNGHSICQSCERILGTQCPVCRTDRSTHRNHALEQIIESGITAFDVSVIRDISRDVDEDPAQPKQIHISQKLIQRVDLAVSTIDEVIDKLPDYSLSPSESCDCGLSQEIFDIQADLYEIRDIIRSSDADRLPERGATQKNVVSYREYEAKIENYAKQNVLLSHKLANIRENLKGNLNARNRILAEKEDIAEQLAQLQAKNDADQQELNHLRKLTEILKDTNQLLANKVENIRNTTKCQIRSLNQKLDEYEGRA